MRFFSWLKNLPSFLLLKAFAYSRTQRGKAVRALAEMISSIIVTVSFIVSTPGWFKTSLEWIFKPPELTINLRALEVSSTYDKTIADGFLCFEPSFSFRETDRTLVVNQIIVWMALSNPNQSNPSSIVWQQNLEWKRYDWVNTFKHPTQISEVCKPQRQWINLKPSDKEPLVLSPRQPLGSILRLTAKLPYERTPYGIGRLSLLQVCLFFDTDATPTQRDNQPPPIGTETCPIGKRFSALAPPIWDLTNTVYRFSIVRKIK
jgi:hypothetical protein